MSKIDLTTVESGFLSQEALNSNFTKLETELQNKVLYRDNPTGEPNSMQQDLDMNGHRILNLLGEGGDGFIWKRSWGAGLAYEVNNIVYVPSGLWEGYAMICREDHTSSALFQTDYSANKWEILAARGASGSGTGDLVAANNLSDVASTTAALTNLNGMPRTGGTFTGDIVVPDEAYDASTWNGNNEVPTKNAIRDKIESLPNPTVLNATNDSTFASTSSSSVTSPEWVRGVLTNFGSKLLGTLTTTSGTVQTLPSLNLTGYTSVRLVFDNVANNAGDSFAVNGPVAFTQATGSAGRSIWGVLDIDLFAGVFTGNINIGNTTTGNISGQVVSVQPAGKCSVTNASTSISVSCTSGSFTSGTVRIYGVL